MCVHKKLRCTPEQDQEPLETPAVLRILLKAREEKVEPAEDSAGVRELPQTPKETGTNK